MDLEEQETDTTAASSTESGRDEHGRFQKGASPGPGRKPARSRALADDRKLLKQDAPRVARYVLALAVGDPLPPGSKSNAAVLTTLARLLFGSESNVAVNMSNIKLESPRDLARARELIAKMAIAVSAGNLSPDEGRVATRALTA